MNNLNIVESAFFDELSQINKEASKVGIVARGLKYLGGGLKGWGNVLQGNTRPGKFIDNIKEVYNRGATRAIKGGAEGAQQGAWGGIKSVAKSRYGQMAAVPAIGAAGLYAGNKLLNSTNQSQGY
jgi:hypothetical protein